MVFFNYALRKLNAKIVYYGPGLCGKTTNLQWIHDHFEGGQRGKMISLATEGDRTIFFDLLPIDIGSIRGMDVTLQLYTVPGQVHYNSTRQLVLRGADGVVFVADSQRTMRSSNAESFENLQENLMLQGIDLKDFPHVIQFNKRDLRDLLSTDDLNEHLNVFSVPIFEGVATEGIGVQETLEGIVKLVMRNLREKYEPLATATAPQPLSPMKSRGPATPPAPKPAAPRPSPLAPDFVSQADEPPPVVPAPVIPPVVAPPPSFERPAEPPPVARAGTAGTTRDVGPDSGFAAFQNEDGVPTAVYADLESQTGEARPPLDSNWGSVAEPATASPAEASPSDVTAGSGLRFDALGDETLPRAAGESMDDLFEAEPPTVKDFMRTSFAGAGAVADSTVAPPKADRYVDRIEAPGPFAPPPVSAASVPPPTHASFAAPATPELEIDLQEMAVSDEVRQAFGAAENREALASLWDDAPSPVADTDAYELETAEERPLEPPFAAAEAPSFVDEATPTVFESADAGDADYPEDEPTFDVVDSFEPERVWDPNQETELDEPEGASSFEAPAEPPAPPQDDWVDLRSRPIMVGVGDPFADDDVPPVHEILPERSPIVPSRGAFEVRAEDNQLRLQLRGSGAIAEMGQVRALDIEVPVPGQWVGNRKVTLQLRLTLTPAEDGDD
ncbi:MAG: ADP-ribosylation factor-like protein [Thermoanaerobaculales bacterium]|jgi:signal recognition particle receptor subunit beta|nr:ADP-ribosylation factor-like protein [Thermoanaerobaculales bacterium]